MNELRLEQFRVDVAFSGLGEIQVSRYPGLDLHFPRSGEAYIFTTQVHVIPQFLLYEDSKELCQHWIMPLECTLNCACSFPCFDVFIGVLQMSPIHIIFRRVEPCLGKCRTRMLTLGLWINLK